MVQNFQSLTETKQRWSLIEKETSNIVWSCPKFDKYILRHPGVTIDTKTKSLLLILILNTCKRFCYTHLKAEITCYKKQFYHKTLTEKDELLSCQWLDRQSIESRKLAEEIRVYDLALSSPLLATDQQHMRINFGSANYSSCSKVIEYMPS